jgi:hypothetical protein
MVLLGQRTAVTADHPLDFPITYILVEDSELNKKATGLHVLNVAEIGLLRCWMTLLLLPSSAADLVPDQPPFTSAISRVRNLPRFRKVQSLNEPPPALWDGMLDSDLLVLMVGGDIPNWLEKLAGQRHIGLLSPSVKLVDSLRAPDSVHVGLLKGREDLREAYRVFHELFKALSTEHPRARILDSIRAVASGADLLSGRPRLEFIPPFPLPQPDEGRPAAYLLNRLSNAMDEPSLRGQNDGRGAIHFPQLLDWSIRGCAALALHEMGEEHPSDFPVSRQEVEQYHVRISDRATEAAARFHLLLELGQRVTRQDIMGLPFLVVPSPRLDLIRGAGPETIAVTAADKKLARVRIRAVADAILHKAPAPFKTGAEKIAYQGAQESLIMEQRLISCQSAWLAARTGTVPIQLEPLPGNLYSALHNLSRALEHDSRKISELFKGVEFLLSQRLPAGLLELLGKATSPVTLFSDLPLEWTLIGEWPVCLTRPVCRILVAANHWDVLCAALEAPVSIDTSKPEQVLILDLIEGHDLIREHSDAFMAASAANALHYTYASPKDPEELKGVLDRLSPTVVVLDAHGLYDRRKDALYINLGGKPCAIDDFLPFVRVPPLWVLSACHTSVVGALRGCFVRKLLSLGAVCVVATLSRVDAFTASMFTGRLLTDIFSPVRPGIYRNFHEVFFITQYTTALLYDPLLPLIRRSESDVTLKRQLGSVLSEFFARTGDREFDIREHKHEIAYMLGELLARHGLQDLHTALTRAGQVRPETLLFTAFGAPGHIGLEYPSDSVIT